MSGLNFSFRGLMAPVFTPFDQDKNLNLKIIPEYAKYLYLKGIKGILVNGTTGEGVSLTMEERKQILCSWMASSKQYHQTIMVQIGGTNMKDVKSMARHAENLKVSALLCLPDLFFKPANVDDLVHYLKLISSEAPFTPLLYYHIPSYTGVDISITELLKKSSEIPTFTGIKYTSNDLVTGAACVSGDFNQHPVFLGCDNLLLSALFLGFDSAIGTTINMFPEENINIFQYFAVGHYAKASEEQKKLNNKILSITKSGSWVSSMKAAMRLLTPIDVGPVRDPLSETKISMPLD